ncbi:helix-turn-helix domain-containing protein [Vibrio quintilis]|uniref:Arabinose operon regulatory protein n=1 Tax=Vibrio quintilis TaxID=1117707 RepID=A0A1M7YR70_9VIBR|nr:AraC family transcriptional regulator [Vibrio quintilis]SHO55108.1 Arabinose operon regulatory protein [Vibrio quintilis]
MTDSLSIRSYCRQKNGHRHDFYQLVLPLRGVINMEVGAFQGKVIPGECVVVMSGEMHYFSAQEEAKFVVADLSQLPEQITDAATKVFSLTPPLLHFLNFIEQQLKYQVNADIEQLMLNTFRRLLAEQRLIQKFDHRIRNVLEYMEMNLSQPLSIDRLSAVACLSPTQFKKIFKQQTGLSVTQYLIQLRMEKAQALLLHTDYPVQRVAEAVGYTDLSAFSRRFSLHFGLSPSKYT